MENARTRPRPSLILRIGQLRIVRLGRLKCASLARVSRWCTEAKAPSGLTRTEGLRSAAWCGRTRGSSEQESGKLSPRRITRSSAHEPCCYSYFLLWAVDCGYRVCHCCDYA